MVVAAGEEEATLVDVRVLGVVIRVERNDRGQLRALPRNRAGRILLHPCRVEVETDVAATGGHPAAPEEVPPLPFRAVVLVALARHAGRERRMKRTEVGERVPTFD